ncbi:MAG: response regulator transcription factor [Pedobacter sp.]|nr:MAG: response regulator transcription factor [Pedobacter sp.]
MTGSYANPIEALQAMQVTTPDVLFLDIDMPELSGLDFIKSISEVKTINVIISSHPEYALEGFQLNVFDFILKPLETSRFEHTLKRIQNFAQLKSKADAYDVLFENEKIIFKEGHNMVNLNANEISYLEAYGDYTKIVTEKKSHLTLATLSNFLESLPQGKFLRIHRSYIIAKDKISSFGPKFVNIGPHILPIGKTYIKTIKSILHLS